MQGSKGASTHITSEQCADKVGRTGHARYSVNECRETGTRVVPQRSFHAFVSFHRDKGVFFIMEDLMTQYFLLAAQMIVLITAGILLWQVWHYLHRKDIPEDEPLGEVRAKYLTRRLTVLSVCAVVEAVLAITQAILRFVEGL